jgi:hypothetical protein
MPIIFKVDRPFRPIFRSILHSSTHVRRLSLLEGCSPSHCEFSYKNIDLILTFQIYPVKPNIPTVKLERYRLTHDGRKALRKFINDNWFTLDLCDK